MNNQEALNTLNDIRNMMEKSTRFVSFSGLSSIVIGIYACIAAIIAYSILGNTTPVPRLDVDTPAKLQLLIVFASLLIIVCIVTVILMCRHKAHQNNQSLLFDFNTKRLLWNFFLPLVVGGILCISLIWQSHYGLTSSIMLIFYGVALISASNYTFSNTRYLGYAEIALGLAEPEKDVWELYEHTRTASKCLPVASILTIAAAGSETSNSSVITRVDTHQKRAYNDDISRPKFAIMDPELTKTLPDYQTESGCADIMMHTMERYFTNGGNMELTDALAEGLLRTVMKNAVILHTDPANYEARAEVMWAGSLSHNGLTGCGIARGDFMSHKLEHEMGGMFDVTHGAGLAALWPSWARYVYKDCLPRFVRFARNVMGVTADGTDEEIALKGIDAMVDFYHSIGMPASFHELGIDPTDAQIDEMARRCLEASGSALGSAKKLDLDDMIAIYHAANH